MKPWLVHTEELSRYAFGAGHPMGSHRVRASLELARSFGLLELFDVAEPPPADDALLLTVHSPEYLAALRTGQAHPQFGIGTEDQPLTPGLPEVASRIVTATTHAAEAVWSGRTRRAVNVSGGLHHAAAGAMSGFCMYNDTAVAIRRLLDLGAERVAYLDLDAHHGDGVEQIFWDDPRVLTISVHESGLYLFPGTGFPGDVGGPDAAGTAVNVALDKHTDDFTWLRTIHAIVPPLLQAFRPQVLFTQHGADPHRSDPLTDFDLTVDAMSRMYHTVGSWADRFAQGRWVALGGGGYNRDAVARTWVLLLAAVAGVEIDPTVPLPSGGLLTSETLGDEGADAALRSYRSGAAVTENPPPAVVATSRAVFPYWGLNPYQL